MRLAACHPTKKVEGRGMCKNCYDKWLKQTNPSYKKNQLSNTTKWKLKNPDRWRVHVETRKAKDAKDPIGAYLRSRAKSLKKKYRMTLDDYDLMLKGQGGGCALCSRRPGKTPLHVDHDHKTNKIRGLLCHQCNWYLGTIDADVKILSRIFNYLELDPKKILREN